MPRRLPLMLLAVFLIVAPARANLEISLDAQTMTDLLTTMLPERVEVPVIGDSRINVGIDNVKVLGFDPLGGAKGDGVVLTSLHLKVRELGIDSPVSPRLSLYVGEEDDRTVCYLVFEEAKLPLPVSGPVDIAPLLPRIPIPADSIFGIEGQRGDFDVRMRLVDVVMGRRALRFDFDLAVSPRP